ncbi:triosephosphate isomerase [Candidatus Woesebacteria bacterium]|nr:triosephosphate isomerase [Candidatus Woesebacteria bacterium]
MNKIVIANWKSQKLQNQIVPWFDAVGEIPSSIECIIMPAFPLLPVISQQLTAGMKLGAQNVSPFPMGAYTGEVAAAQLADMNVTHCLVGHSERRSHFAETDELVAAKCQLLQDSEIKPVVCVDEPYLDSQVAALQAIGITDIILAYEPLSAIGSGHSEGLSHVQRVVSVAKKLGDFPVIYGGSVSADTVGEYLLVCDGVLVATHSLDGADFSRLLAVAAAEKPSFSV